MALSNDGIRPNALELRIRFGCGFVLGAALGACVALRHGGVSPMVAVLTSLAGGSVFGIGSLHFGDRFWTGVLEWLGSR